MFDRATITLGIGPHSSFGSFVRRDFCVNHYSTTALHVLDSMLYLAEDWRRAVVASVVRRMNEVTLCRARLILGSVTVFGQVYDHGM